MAEFEIQSPSGKLHASLDTLGGFVSEFYIEGFNILVPRTHDNPGRSGIPRLGPTPGSIKGRWKKLAPDIPKHGTDRLKEMRVQYSFPEVMLLELLEQPELFPGNWRTNLLIGLQQNSLTLLQAVTNLDGVVRERGVGFHPYFDHAEEMVFAEDSPFKERPELGESRLIKGVSGFGYRVRDRQVQICCSPRPEMMVDWTDKDSYRCMEPWWAKIGSGLTFQPGESKSFAMSISVT